MRARCHLLNELVANASFCDSDRPPFEFLELLKKQIDAVQFMFRKIVTDIEYSTGNRFIEKAQKTKNKQTTKENKKTKRKETSLTRLTFSGIDTRERMSSGLRDSFVNDLERMEVSDSMELLHSSTGTPIITSSGASSSSSSFSFPSSSSSSSPSPFPLSSSSSSYLSTSTPPPFSTSSWKNQMSPRSKSMSSLPQYPQQLQQTQQPQQIYGFTPSFGSYSFSHQAQQTQQPQQGQQAQQAQQLQKAFEVVQKHAQVKQQQQQQQLQLQLQRPRSMTDTSPRSNNSPVTSPKHTCSECGTTKTVQWRSSADDNQKMYKKKKTKK